MGKLPVDDYKIVDVLVSGRGTRAQLAATIRRMADLIDDGESYGIRVSACDETVCEFDVLRVTPGKPRLSNRAILKADAMGLLDAAQAEPEASESAMRGEGEMAGGL